MLLSVQMRLAKRSQHLLLDLQWLLLESNRINSKTGDHALMANDDMGTSNDRDKAHVMKLMLLLVYTRLVKRSELSLLNLLILIYICFFFLKYFNFKTSSRS